MLYRWLRPLLFRLPAETAHGLIQGLLRGVQVTPLRRLLKHYYAVCDPRLAVEAFGLTFPVPVGVAAGFDKNARVFSALEALGFGHVEVGAVTPRAQSGNPRPRLFRLRRDEALVNRMGFNNQGAEAVASRLRQRRSFDVPLGINLGKMKRTSLRDAADDYRTVYRRLEGLGDYYVVNVSSPNTPELRRLQGRDYLETIVEPLLDDGARPILIKLSPDLERRSMDEVLAVVEEYQLDGVIATNTTVERPKDLRSPHRHEEGGLSGRPLEPMATDVVRYLAKRTDVPVVGVGGVFSGRDAYRKIKAGARLVQLYTGLVYRGPSIAKQIHRDLLRRLDEDGFTHLDEAVGADLD